MDRTEIQEIEEETWDTVISPEVREIMKGFEGKAITPQSFKEIHEALSELTTAQNIEFLLIQGFLMVSNKRGMQ